MPPKVAARAAAAAAAQLAISPGGKPPSDWRSGDPHRTYSPPGRKRSPVRPGDGRPGAMYPPWWGDGEEWSSAQASPGPRSRSAPRADRRPPRLAYSVQLEPGQPLWQNDLVTARYLDVPSSGYGRPYSPPRVPPQYMPPPQPPQEAFSFPPPPQPVPVQGPYGPAAVYGAGRDGAAGPQLYVVHPTGALVPVGPAAQGPPQQQQHRQQQQQQAAAGGKPAWKPIRTAKVQSRIREQVEADKAAARARAAARQQAAAAAVAGGTPHQSGAPQKHQERPGSAASAPTPAGRPAAAAARPSDIADSLAANPYTSWFITGQPNEEDPRGPQQGSGHGHQNQEQQQSADARGDFASDFATLRPAQPRDMPTLAAMAGPAPPAFLAASDSGRRAAGPTWLDHSPSGAATPLSTARSSQHWPAWSAAAVGPLPGAAPSSQGAERGAAVSGSGPGPGLAPSYPSWPAPSSSHPSSHGSMWHGTAAGGSQERRHAWGEEPQDAQQAAPGSGPSWLAGPAWMPMWHQPQPSPLQQQQHSQAQQLPLVPSAWVGGSSGSGVPSSRGSELQLGAGASGAAGGFAPPPARLSQRQEALKAVRPEVAKWSKSWVGDFGHLEEPRFPPRRPPESESRISQPPPDLDRRATSEANAAIARLQQQRRQSMAAQEPSDSATPSAASAAGAAAATAAAAAGSREGQPHVRGGAGADSPDAAWSAADSRSAGDARHDSPYGGYGAATVLAAEREFGRVMGQVARLTAAPEPELGGAGELPGGVGGQAEAVGGADARGRLWNFDEIVSSPSHLTYQ